MPIGMHISRSPTVQTNANPKYSFRSPLVEKSQNQFPRLWRKVPRLYRKLSQLDFDEFVVKQVCECVAAQQLDAFIGLPII